MLAKILSLVAFLAIVRGDPEPPVGRVAPYAAAGWHPRTPFNLPNEFLPARSSSPRVEITKARVEQVYPSQQLDFQPISRPASQYGPPDPGFKLDIPEEDRIQPISRPANQYGTPDSGFKIVYPDDEEPTTPKDSADPNQPSIREGRYFIISQDNKLQRVTYSSEQNGNDEDFTARLSYSTVGQLKDPVYRYNSQGQLERVLKK